MSFAKHYALRLTTRFLLVLAPGSLLLASPSFSQSRTADETSLRGDHPEIVITIKDTASQILPVPATVKVYRAGALTGQQPATKGRAFFILDALGDYTINVDASGYQSAQRDINIPMSMKFEIDINLQRLPNSNETTGVPGKPVLAPKAREALDKGLEALGQNNLKDAAKNIAEASKLAPDHPDVLFVQGVLYLDQRNWADAQGVLEKASQMDPGNTHILSALGMALTDQGKYAEAISPLEKSLQGDSGEWEARWALAKSYYYHQQYNDALKSSQLALTASNGKAPQIELLVAQSLTAVGRYDEAAADLRDFLKNHADRPEAPTAKRWLDGLTKSGKIH